MLIGDLLDTIMNITTFAFIAAMIWLLVRKPGGTASDDPSPTNKQHQHEQE